MMRVGFIGPLVGRNPGRVTTQGEKLADAFASAGYPVVAASSSANRYVRLADITATVIRHRRDLDVVVLFTYGQASFVVEDIASGLADRFGIPVVLAMCGGAMPDFIDKYPSWTRRVFSRAKAIVCQSEYLARTMRRLGKTPRVIPNIIDTDAYTFKKRDRVAPRLFWMRAFEDLYNPEMALRVLDRVRKRHPDATLVMAGQDSGGQQQTISTAEKMGLSSSIKFAGFLDMAGKQREADATDIFINTPRIDNRPICVVEAGAFGLPIVSTNVGGMSDLVEHEVTALLVPTDDDRAMADAVERLIASPELASTLSRNGQQLAAASSSRHVVPAWEALLREVKN